MLALKKFIESHKIQYFIITLIIINAGLLGLETSASIMAEYGREIIWLDNIILAVFVIEIAIRIYVYRQSFFKDPWSLFDFAVVMIALIPATGPFAIVRALRVLRVLRLLTMIPSMQRVVGALLSAIPGLGSIALVLLIFYYVSAVMATHFFGENFPQWFGDIGKTLYTLFQIMTLESWSMGIVRPVMETAPLAWLFFIPFILIATFTMLNLFIAIIVNAMQNVKEKGDNNDDSNKITIDKSEWIQNKNIEAELTLIREQLKELKKMTQETRVKSHVQKNNMKKPR